MDKLLEIMAKQMALWYSGLDPKHEVLQGRPKVSELREEHITSHLVAAYLKADNGKRNKHPAKTHPHLFNKKRAQAVLTYQWKSGLGGKNGVIKMIKDAKVPADTNLWIDVWFIDQNSRNIGVELAISQEYYILCPLHLVAGSNERISIQDETHLLRRGWCLWELGLRAHSKKQSLIMGNVEIKVSTNVPMVLRFFPLSDQAIVTDV